MKIKQVAIAFILALVCVFFTGCASYVNVYTTKNTSDYYTCAVDVYVDKTEASALEEHSEGSVKTYLSRLASVCGVADSCSMDEDENGIYFTFSAMVETSQLKREEYTTTVEKGLFFNKVQVSFKNPLDRFKDAYLNGVTEVPERGTDMYLVYVILNGEGNLSSFSDYFGVGREFAEDLSINFLVKTRTLYTSDAQTEYVLATKYFKWSSTLSEDGGYITYTATSVNTWPWFLLAGILGVAVVVILLLIAKKSKKEAHLEDFTDLETKRMLKKILPPGAKIRQVKPMPTDEKLFDEDDETK